MKDNAKIQKIAGWCFVYGVVIFAISCVLSIYRLCGLDNNPSGFSGALCNFAYSGLGNAVMYITHFIGAALVLVGAIIWMVKVNQKNKSKTSKP